MHRPADRRSKRAPAIVPYAWLALWVLGAACDHARSGEPAASVSSEPTTPAADRGDRIEKLDGVDVSQLTDHEVETWTQLVNEQLSPCGEPMSVARCVDSKHSCRACLPAARYLTRMLLEGYDKPTIEQRFATRFSAKEKQDFKIDGAKVRGSLMAPVTIVEFSDFQCPHCAAAHPELASVVRENEGRVKIVFKHYPLPGHSRAVPAARAAEAAARQGKFWEMADLLFENQRTLEDSDLVGFATRIGLDMERFNQDYASEEVAKAVDADRSEGEGLKIEGTPTLYINGHKLDEPLKALPAYIKEELDL